MPFAVVIPAYNDRSRIATAVRSALDQPEVSEVVVVDDGSTDDTAEVAVSSRDPRVQVVRQQNAGPASARNTGIGASTAGFVVFLDSDDELVAGSLRGLEERHLAGALLVRSGAVVVGAAEPRPERTWLAEPSDLPYPRGAPLAGTFSVARSALDRVGGYDPAFRYGENSELLLRLTADIGPGAVSYADWPTVRRIERGGRSSDFYLSRRLSAALRMLDVHASELDADAATRANHHAIISRLLQAEGRRIAAVHHAAEAAMIRPGFGWRDWGRVILCLGPRRPLHE